MHKRKTVKLNLTIAIEPSALITDTHQITLFHDNEAISYANLTLDEIEDLEVTITNSLVQLSKYRREKQREELDL